MKVCYGYIVFRERSPLQNFSSPATKAKANSPAVLCFSNWEEQDLVLICSTEPRNLHQAMDGDRDRTHIGALN
ncbi:hypothetical protein LEMLEM_LOCUS998 [Lemmus lemmus]